MLNHHGMSDLNLLKRICFSCFDILWYQFFCFEKEELRVFFTTLDFIIICSLILDFLITLINNTFCRKSRSEVFPAGIYLFEVNTVNTRTIFEICSNVTVKSLERSTSMTPFRCLYC